MNTNLSLCIIAAGSGGHILPAQQLAQQWKLTHRHASLIWCTGTSALERQLVTEKDNETVTHFELSKFPGTLVWRYPKFIWQLLVCFLQSFSLLRTDKKGQKIEKVITTGGLLSIPICLTAWMLGIPFELIELNAIPGKATRFLASKADKINVVFGSTHKYFPSRIVEKIKYPLRFSHTDILPQTEQSIKKTIALLGGSQGSQQLNTLLLDWLEQHPETWKNLRVLHYFGADTTRDFGAWYHVRGIEHIAQPFCTTMPQAYAEADLVISRAGSGALHELLFFNKKSIIVPLQNIADGHQVVNATEMAQQYPELFTVIVGNKQKCAADVDCALQNFINQTSKTQEPETLKSGHQSCSV